MTTIFRLTAGAVFPEGAAPGAGGSGSHRIIDRDGRGRPLLRGSALAGVMRHAYAGHMGQDTDAPEVCRWFGTAAGQGLASPLSISDAPVLEEKCRAKADNDDNTHGVAVIERTHNMILRHTGAVADKALFSLEALAPGTRTCLSLTLNPEVTQDPDTDLSSDPNFEDAQRFLQEIAGILNHGLMVGGSSNRGIGRMILTTPCRVSRFDTSRKQDLARYLDTVYQELQCLKNGEQVPLQGEEICPDQDTAPGLTVDLTLGIPRGEDLLVGDGEPQPQVVTFADGTKHWRIPGSSLRGVIRAWISRLAARQIAREIKGGASSGEKQVLDGVQRFYNAEDNPDTYTYNPHMAGLGFVEKEADQAQYHEDPASLNDPVLDLFGSMYQKGRFHISDAFSKELALGEGELRIHVAVDRISGGAHEGGLFQNRVLTGPGLVFTTTLLIDSPQEQEVQWLAKTLRAIHLGIVRVGSSKASGRLEIRDIKARGPMATIINELKKEVS